MSNPPSLKQFLVDSIASVTGRRVAPRAVRLELSRAKASIRAYQKLFPNEPWVTEDLDKKLKEVKRRLDVVKGQVNRLCKERRSTEAEIREWSELSQLIYDLEYFENDAQAKSSAYKKAQLHKDPRFRNSAIAESEPTTTNVSDVSNVSDSQSVPGINVEEASTAENEGPALANHESHHQQSQHWGTFTFSSLKAGTIRATRLSKCNGGSFSLVWECEVLPEDAERLKFSKIAFKQLLPTRISSTIESDELLKLNKRLHREKATWKDLCHPNIALFLGHTLESPVGMASPYYANGTILEYSRNRPSGVKLKLIRGTAAGLAYLHNSTRNIIHGDLRSTNVLVDDEGQARIIDFGGSFIPQDFGGAGVANSTLSDSEVWMAPERVGSVNGVSRFANVLKETDVYSFGLVSIHVITQKRPYPLIPIHEFYSELKDAVGGKASESFLPTLREEWPKWEDKQLWNLLETCWALDPKNRPEIHSALEELSRLEDKIDSA